METGGIWFEYYERSHVNSDAILCQRYNVNTYPDQLLKKVTLLTHFKEYLEAQAEKNPRIEPEDAELYKKTSSNMVYVKKWIKTRHAVLFRMSNKTVQVKY